MCNQVPDENGGCPPDCGHSAAEHRAFDLGVDQGEKHGEQAVNPYSYTKAYDEWDAWETGFSVGLSNGRGLQP